MEMHKNETAPAKQVQRERADTGRDHITQPIESDGDELKEGKTGSTTATQVPARGATPHVKPKPRKNNLRKLRLERMMSKAELARRAGVSTLTIDRVERGMSCRMDTKRKVLEALGLKPSERATVFGEDE